MLLSDLYTFIDEKMGVNTVREIAVDKKHLESGIGKVLYSMVPKPKKMSTSIHIWTDEVSIYMIQDSYKGGKSKCLGWEKFGRFSWWLCDYDGIIHTLGDGSVRRNVPEIDSHGHKNLKIYNKKYDTNINNLIVCDKEIKNMKNQMHFALVLK